MAARKSSDDRPAPPVVRHAPPGELRVHEISEAELEKLENGPPGQVHLSYAPARPPAALTVFVTLQTVEIGESRVFNAYWIAFRLLSIHGLVFLARRFATVGSARALGRDIRSRMPERPGIPDRTAGAARRVEAGPGDA